MNALSTLAWNYSNHEAKPLTNEDLTKLDQLRIDNAIGISKDNNISIQEKKEVFGKLGETLHYFL